MARGGWNPKKVAAFKAGFYNFLENCFIDSKEKGRYCLANGVYMAQKRFLDGIFDGLEEDIHDFKVLKSRQLGITTISRALSTFWIGIHPGLRAAMVFDKADNTEEARREITTLINSLPKALKFPAIKGGKGNRYGLALENGSTINFMSAGVRAQRSTGALGASRGLNFLHACLAPGTPVLVEDGREKPIEAVAVGSKVVTHTGATGTVVANVGQPNTRGDMLKVHAWLSDPIFCTRDHKIATARGLVKAEDLVKSDLLIMPVRRVKPLVKSITLPTTPPRPQNGGGASAGSGARIDLTEEFGFAIGYYLAEGCMTFQRRGERYKEAPSGIVFSRHRTEGAYCDRAIKALQPYTTGARRVVDKPNSLTTTEQIYGSCLARWVRDTFGETKSKRIPDAVFSWGEDFCRGLVAGVLCGDGSKTICRLTTGPLVNKVSLTTTRDSIAYQMRDLVAALGFGWGAVRSREAGNFYGRNCAKIWVANWNGAAAAQLRTLMGLPLAENKNTGKRVDKARIENGTVYIKIRSIETGIKIDRMYDLSIDHDDHTFRTASFSVSNSELCSWDNDEGVVSLQQALAEDFENRLYIYESTARGYNKWKNIWDDCRADPENQRAIFIGWWAKDNQRILKGDPAFQKYGLAPPSEDEARRIREVKDMYGWDITPEQLAWFRRKSDPTFGTNDDADVREDPHLQQNQPWCVTAETRVGTNVGLIRIDQVQAGMTNTLGEVLAAMPTGIARVWRVRTKLGYELRGTANHPLIDVDGNEVEMQHALGVRVKLQPPMFSDKLVTVFWVDGVVKSEVLITPELARFLGIFMGDGTVSGRGAAQGYPFGIACDSKDQDFIQHCHALTRELFGVNTYQSVYLEGQKGSWTSVRASSKTIYETLCQLGCTRTDTGPTKRKVHVPEFIFRSPKHVVAEFLKGVFETDGFVDAKSNRCALASKWPEFTRDLQLLLLMFGITARRDPQRKITNSSGRFYTANQLELRQLEAREFIEQIGFLSDRKRARAEGRAAYHGRLGRKPAPILFEDEVVEVEDTGIDEPVYNLTVSGKHWFDANGIVTHNTEHEAFVMSGSSFFAPEKLTERAAETGEYKYKAFKYYPGTNFLETDVFPARTARDTQLKVWEEPDPTGEYVVAVDPAYGENEKNDRSAIQVIQCFADGVDQVAEFACATVMPHQLAWVAASLAGWYKNATLFIELNGPGGAVLKEYKDLRLIVNNGYLRREAEEKGLRDIFNNVRQYIFSRTDSNTPGSALHWKTNSSLKVEIMERLRDLTHNGGIVIRSLETLEEMRAITRDGDKIAAEGRDKDDRVVALAMAVRCWEDRVRRRLITANHTRRAFQAAKQSSVKDMWFVYSQNQLSMFFKRKELIRRTERLEALRARRPGR